MCFFATMVLIFLLKGLERVLKVIEFACADTLSTLKTEEFNILLNAFFDIFFGRNF